MNIYCTSDGSYRDIIYDKMFVRRCYKKSDGWISFLLLKRMRSHHFIIPIAILVSTVAHDSDDDYEYAQAKWMFVPNPLFFLPRFALVSFISYHLVPGAIPMLLALIALWICVDIILFTILMINDFTNSIRECFYSPSGDRRVRCNIWRTLLIWLLAAVCLPRPASALMNRAAG